MGTAGKGALIQTDLASTLGVTQDQYLFQPIGFDAYNQSVTGGGDNEYYKPSNRPAPHADSVWTL